MSLLMAPSEIDELSRDTRGFMLANSVLVMAWLVMAGMLQGVGCSRYHVEHTCAMLCY